MDIFFFVTTVVVIVIGVLVAFVLWRVERILKSVEHISKQAAMESDLVRQDIAEMRNDIRQGKGRLKSLFSFLGKVTERRTKKSY